MKLPSCSLWFVMVSTLLIAAPKNGRTAEPLTIGGDTRIKFATLDEATAVLTARDDFVRRMSAFDRSSRLKTNKPVTETEFLKFTGEHAQKWEPEEVEKVTEAFGFIGENLTKLNLPLPKRILLIKTTGEEEGGAAYTRGDAIVLPQNNLDPPADRLQRKLAHEVFHILSRHSPELRKQLYGAIGFVPCAELEFPPTLADIKITNPDAPKNDHCIRIRLDDEEYWAIPILYSTSRTYDVRLGGPFFQYMQFQLLLVDIEGDPPVPTPIYKDGQPRLIGVRKVEGFFEKIGQNTGYIIHPEEILADNFALLVTGSKAPRSPEILRKISKVLEQHAKKPTSP